MSSLGMEPVILFIPKKTTTLQLILMQSIHLDNWQQMERKCIIFSVSFFTNNITWSCSETLHIKNHTINQNSTLKALMSTEQFKVYSLKWWEFLKNWIHLSSLKTWLNTVNLNGIQTTKTSKSKQVISIF